MKYQPTPDKTKSKNVTSPKNKMLRSKDYKKKESPEPIQQNISNQICPFLGKQCILMNCMGWDSINSSCNLCKNTPREPN